MSMASVYTGYPMNSMAQNYGCGYGGFPYDCGFESQLQPYSYGMYGEMYYPGAYGGLNMYGGYENFGGLNSLYPSGSHYNGYGNFASYSNRFNRPGMLRRSMSFY